MPAKRAATAVIRIRPASAKREGPWKEYLQKIAATLPGHAAPDEPTTSSFEANATNTDKIIAAIAADLNVGLRGARSAVIDVAFDDKGSTRVRFAISESLKAAASVLGDLEAVVILFRSVPNSRHSIVRLLEELPTLKESTVICGLASDRIIRSDELTWDPGDLTEVVRYTAADFANAVKRRILRRRGVFKSHLQNKHFGFWFSAENSEFELRHVLHAYLDAREATTVVYDHNSEEWLIALLRRTCRDGRSLVSSLDLTEAVLDSLSDDVVVIVGPMWRTGTVFAGLRSRLVDAAADLHFLALMGLRSSGDPRNDYFFTKQLRDGGGADFEVDYLVPVAHDELTDSDWRLGAAEAVGKVEDPYDRWHRPSHAAMWSLVAHLGASPEDPAPKPRQPIRNFPRLRKLSKRDATWLAECLLRVGGEDFRIERPLLIVVLPKEEDAEAKARNGSRRLAEAFKNSLEVTTLQIDRAVFEAGVVPEEIEKFFADRQGYSVIVIDESAISFRSTRSLSDFVAKANGGLQPVYSASVVEAIGFGTAPENHRSLFQWHPVYIESKDPAA